MSKQEWTAVADVIYAWMRRAYPGETAIARSAEFVANIGELIDTFTHSRASPVDALLLYTIGVLDCIHLLPTVEP